MKKVAVLGSYVADLMAVAPHLPSEGETVKGKSFRIGPGGKGFNQAVSCRKAGSEVRFSTKLGRDAFGKMALDFLSDTGIPDDFVFISESEPSGAALIGVEGGTGKNAIIVVSGACGTFDEHDFELLDVFLEGVDYLLLQLEINLDADLEVIDRAYRKGVKVILNPAPAEPIPKEYYSKLYLVTPNETEAAALTGLGRIDRGNCRKAAEYMQALGVGNVVITLGCEGAYLNESGEERFFHNYDVPVVDTTGAGDAFNGGLLAALGKGKSLEEACLYAQVVANLAVTKTGTAPAMPDQAAIDKFIEENNIGRL